MVTPRSGASHYIADGTADTSTFAAVLRTPAWMVHGLCRLVPSVNFFPTGNEPTAPAIAICNECNVKTQCLEYALTERIEHGVWGATIPATRKRLRQQQAGGRA